MTALATALQRVWSAKSRLPRPTGRGTPACFPEPRHPAGPAADWVHTLVELGALAKRIAPTVVVIALRIFR
jgi:hypothetical protein